MSSTPTRIDEAFQVPSRSSDRVDSIGDLNRTIAWTGMACGAALGLNHGTVVF